MPLHLTSELPLPKMDHYGGGDAPQQLYNLLPPLDKYWNKTLIIFIVISCSKSSNLHTLRPEIPSGKVFGNYW